MQLKNYTRKDIVSKAVEYQARTDGDWSQYLSNYEPQRWGIFDTDDCWDCSVVSYVLETQLNYLYQTNQLSQEAISFFTENGYIVNEKFEISERYYGILSKRQDNGGDPWWMASYIQQYGFIPRSMLCYSQEQAAKWTTQEEFDTDYFNPEALTPEMEALGKQAASYISVNPYRVGEVGVSPDLQSVWAALMQCPLAAAIPIPNPPNLWNEAIVPYQGGTDGSHVVGIYQTSPQYTQNAPSALVPIVIGDNYQPTPKTLQAGYFLCEVVAIVITTVATVTEPIQQTVNQSVWSAVFEWFNSMWNEAFGIRTESRGQLA